MWRTLAALLATAVGALTLPRPGRRPPSPFRSGAPASRRRPSRSTTTTRSPGTTPTRSTTRSSRTTAPSRPRSSTPGQSWTKTLSTAGTFRYHDALYPRRPGKITVKGPPPSVSLALSVPIVVYGTSITLSGAISTGAANQSVELDQQPYGPGLAEPDRDREDRRRRRVLLDVTPSLYTTYTARWNNVTSASVVAQVAPKMRLSRAAPAT